MKQGLNQTNVFVINSQAGETVPLTASNVSSNVKFFLPSSVANYDVIVTNAGTVTAFIAFGVGSSTAAVVPSTTGTTGATPILPGAILVLQKNSDAIKADYCAGITSASSTTLYFTSVQGS